MGTFGGAIKNMGVGCASKRGKLNLHLGTHPKYGMLNASFISQRCTGKDCASWDICSNSCPFDAIEEADGKINWIKEKCVGCMACYMNLLMCGALVLPDDIFDATSAAIADSALATVKAVSEGKIAYINLAIDIAPWCDCGTYSDRSILPNLGVFASWDPVALDSACLQKSTESAGIPGSFAMERGVMEPGLPKFTACGSMMGISEDIQPNVAQKIGLGTREFELIEVPPADVDKPFLFTTVPTGMRFTKMFEKKPDLVPPGGFKQADEVDIEDMR